MLALMVGGCGDPDKVVTENNTVVVAEPDTNAELPQYKQDELNEVANASEAPPAPDHNT